MEEHNVPDTTVPDLIIPDFNTIVNDVYDQSHIWLIDQINNNDFLVGFMFTAAVAALAYISRGLWGTLIRYIKIMSTSEITFNSDNNYYHDISEYLFKHSVSKMFQRFFILSYNWKDDGMQLTVGYGRSFGFIGGWPVIINRTREDSTSSRFKEVINIIIIGGRHSVIKCLIDACADIVHKDNFDDFVRIYKIAKDGEPTEVAKKPYRSLDTIIIPQSDKDYIIDKIDGFIKSEKKYLSMGLPYHLGIILSGPPGTGKTSLIHAIASHYKRNVYFQTGMTIDTSAMDINKSILVIEDIDTNGMSVKKRQETEMSSDGDLIKAINEQSMSSILNVLDGLLSPHGLITIATTNHYESLDPAIVRPGRFDVHLEFNLMDWAEWLGLSKLLDREQNIISEGEYSIVSPAQARYMLLYYTDDEITEYFNNQKHTH
jgi:chaperone BCS1